MQSAGYIIPERHYKYRTAQGDYSTQVHASRRSTVDLLSHALVSKHLEGSIGGSFSTEQSERGKLGTADNGHRIKYLVSQR